MDRKAQGFNAHTKYRILQHALKGNNVTRTCKLFGISRTTYYHWQSAYQRFGMGGLESKVPKKPEMPNKVGPRAEREILAYAAEFPADGPRRIYYELKAAGIQVGESGIFNVLERNHLTRKNQRMEYAKHRVRHGHIHRKREPPPKFMVSEASYPGYLVLQSIDFMGTFDGIGRIYQYCFYDTSSKWGEVKLYNRKQDIDIWHFFESKLSYLLDTFNLNIHHLVTKKEREFLPYFVKGDQYHQIMDAYPIDHHFIPPEQQAVFQDLILFQEYLVKEFYSRIPFHRPWDSFVKVAHAIHHFIRTYNFIHIISEGPNQGKTPAEVVLERAIENGTDLDTLPLWLLALINSPSRGVGNADEQRG